MITIGSGIATGIFVLLLLASMNPLAIGLAVFLLLAWALSMWLYNRDNNLLALIVAIVALTPFCMALSFVPTGMANLWNGPSWLMAQVNNQPVIAQNNTDLDGDNVIDSNDECPNTPPNSEVGRNGCSTGPANTNGDQDQPDTYDAGDTQPTEDGLDGTWAPDCQNLTEPKPGGVIYWSNHRAGTTNVDPYAVVYIPWEGGSSDHRPYGWWMQPCLPKPEDRVEHTVAIVLMPGSYRFTGPECTAWLNTDQKHPGNKGTVLVDRQNVSRMIVPETATTGESWVFMTCRTSWASGFSFEKLEGGQPMPINKP